WCEGPVERDRGDHLAASPSGADNGDLSRSRRLVALADAKAPGRLDGQPGVAPQHALECGAVARKKRPLEGGLPGEPPSSLIGRAERLLVSRQRGPKPRLQPRIHPPGLALRRDGRKAPEGGR